MPETVEERVKIAIEQLSQFAGRPLDGATILDGERYVVTRWLMPHDNMKVIGEMNRFHVKLRDLLTELRNNLKDIQEEEGW